MTTMEQTIRERAYHLWLADGCPDGKCEAFWLDAQRDVLADSIAAAMSVIDPVVRSTAKKPAVMKKSKGATKKMRAA